MMRNLEKFLTFHLQLNKARVWIRAAAGRQTDKERKEEEIKKYKKTDRWSSYVNVSFQIFKYSDQTKNKNGLVLHNQTLLGFSVLFSARKNCFTKHLSILTYGTKENNPFTIEIIVAAV
jgi:hypothetical protein